MVRIETERLVLRTPRADDLAAFHGILSDPRATAYWSTLPHADMATTADWLASMLEIPPAEGEDFVVEHDGALIGKAGFYRFPEIGFIFHPDHWGRGFAAEALRVILDRGFAVHGLVQAEADVDPRNEACLRLLTRLGFRETGRAARTWQIGDLWCDSIYLALGNPDPAIG